jgi:hypothetical protein
MSFTVEDNRKKEGDHHDRCPNHRDAPAGNESVEKDAGDSQTSSPFPYREREEKKFRTLEKPGQQEE